MNIIINNNKKIKKAHNTNNSSIRSKGVSGSSHKEKYIRALFNGVKNGDLTRYQADKLRREYDNEG